MPVPQIYLLEKKPLMVYRCGMCKKAVRQNKFLWVSWFTKDEIVICRDCAYKETFGTKKMNKAKKENRLEEKSTNQKRD